MFVCIGRRVNCRGERRWLMMRNEARHPATEKGLPWNAQGADRFESECRHGLSDPMWCNICSQDSARRETVKAEAHELPWSQGS